jgi:hypothetical protein
MRRMKRAQDLSSKHEEIPEELRVRNPGPLHRLPSAAARYLAWYNGISSW